MGRFKTPLPGLVRRVERLFNGIACGRGQRRGGASAQARAFPASSAVATMLPVELWEIIIACICHDWSDACERRRALSSCALTCRTFSLIVRQFVFHTIRLSQMSEHPNYAHFVDIIQHSPYVALCVRQLSISIDWSVEHWHSTLPAILPRLHEVETLILDFNGSTYEVAEHMRDRLTTYFHSVRHLHLHFVNFDTANDLFDILCACPKLSSLCLSHVHCDNSENPPVFNVVSLQPVVLNEFSFEDTRSEIMTWLTHGPFQLSLQFLQALWDDSSNGSCLAGVGHVLKTVGTSLQNLKLEVTAWVSQRSQIDTSWNTQLSNIHLQIRMGSVQALEVDAILHLMFRRKRDHDMLSSTYEWISSALASVRSRQLRNIDFVFESHKGGDLSALDWEKIDEHLERLARMRAFPEQLQVLFRLNFVNQDETAESYSADTVNRRLPRLLTSSAKVDITTVTAGWLESSSIHPWRY